MKLTDFSSKPNVLIIITDQEREVMHWPAGWAEANLPARRRLMANGLHFTRAQCNTAACSSSQSEMRWRLVSGTTTRGANPPSTKEPIERRSGQRFRRPSRHHSHLPHVEKYVSQTTRAPIQPASTPSPTSRTTAETSCPIVTGGTLAYSAASMWRSVPHTPAPRTSSSTSSGPGPRSGRSARPTFPGPGASFARPITRGRSRSGPGSSRWRAQTPAATRAHVAHHETVFGWSEELIEASRRVAEKIPDPPSAPAVDVPVLTEFSGTETSDELDLSGAPVGDTELVVGGE